ncbi:MAG: hypothetical protein Q8S20_20830 [Sulfuritalea sp.]|nr:hypothetical protein [Sulfuritalea sp.]
MKPPASKNKRKPNDGYDPLTFKHDDVRKMTAKEQGEDLLRILIAGLQRKLNLPQTTIHPQTARPRKKGTDQPVQQTAAISKRWPKTCTNDSLKYRIVGTKRRKKPHLNGSVQSRQNPGRS